MREMITVFWKELADHFSSRRFIILFALVLLAGVFAVYVSVQGIRAATIQSTPSTSMSTATSFVFGVGTFAEGTDIRGGATGSCV